MRIRLVQEEIELFPQRAMYWAAGGALFIADPHFGKTAAFRAAGIAAPETVTEHDLALLDRLLAETNATRLVILGDFFHARDGRIPETETCIARWRASHTRLAITLVRGNHDVGAGDPPGGWGIECVDPGASMGPFVLCHAPEDKVSSEGYRLCGHLHPAAILHDGSCMSPERAACFLFRAGLGVLPAFGRFTGMRAVQRGPGDRVYAIADGMVLEIPSLAFQSGSERKPARSSTKSRHSFPPR